MDEPRLFDEPAAAPPATRRPASARRRARRLPGILSVARVGLLLLCFSSLVQHACVSSYRISGNSMMPSYSDGDRVVVARKTPLSGSPDRGDAVICRVDGEVLIKRVIGLPGETIEIQDGRIIDDGVPLDDPVPNEFRIMRDMQPVVLGEDEYFVLGDHRRVSIDSREFGPVLEGDILGRVILRLPARREAVAAGR